MNFEEPFSRSARWSRRLGVFALPVLFIAVLVQRSGEADIASAFAGIGAALALAALAVILGFGALAVIWVRGYRGAGAAIWGILCGVLVLVGPVLFIASGWHLPPINDISTDPANPPPFVFAAAECRPGDNPIAYPGGSTAIEQMAAYPDIGPLRLAVPPDEAHALALQAVEEQGWRILDPGTGGAQPRRRIEAVATSRILRLASDVVIRIAPDEGGSRVDMRSASRLGDRDFGANAARIRAFLSELATQAR